MQHGSAVTPPVGSRPPLNAGRRLSAGEQTSLDLGPLRDTKDFPIVPRPPRQSVVRRPVLESTMRSAAGTGDIPRNSSISGLVPARQLPRGVAETPVDLAASAAPAKRISMKAGAPRVGWPRGQRAVIADSMPDASGDRLRMSRRSPRSASVNLMEARSDIAPNHGPATLHYGTSGNVGPSRPPGPSAYMPKGMPTLRPAALIHREPVQPAVVAHPPVDVALQAPTPPAYLPVDVDRLDNELWRRFEKRVRIENERRGRG